LFFGLPPALAKWTGSSNMTREITAKRKDMRGVKQSIPRSKSKNRPTTTRGGLAGKKSDSVRKFQPGG
jgi:hypothetical protein